MGTGVQRDHVFLTRFNMPSEGVENHIRQNPQWLKDRVRLFETYCLPSMRAQTLPDYRWIVYFDAQSPTWLRDRIDAWSILVPMHPVFRVTVSRQERLADILEAVRQPADYLLTTNLDNDDGLALDFVERLARFEAQETRTVLYFGRGLIQANDRLYLREDRTNAFCSVLESWSNPVTCWVAPHNQLQQLMPEVVLDGPPAWMQTIHGNNVSNRVHGRLVAPAPYLNTFAGLDKLPAIGRHDLVLDLCLGVPQRAAVSSARHAVKWLALHLGGKSTSDKLKIIWYRLRKTLGAGFIG